jgi:hypothetical protein
MSIPCKRPAHPRFAASVFDGTLHRAWASVDGVSAGSPGTNPPRTQRDIWVVLLQNWITMACRMFSTSVSCGAFVRIISQELENKYICSLQVTL